MGLDLHLKPIASDIMLLESCKEVQVAPFNGKLKKVIMFLYRRLHSVLTAILNKSLKKAAHMGRNF